MSIDLVIFDMDGVLVDSEPISNEVTAQCLTEAGYRIDKAGVASRFLGIGIDTMLAGIAAEQGRPLPDDLGASIERRTLEAYEGRLEPVAGMADLLAGLDGARCVASSSTPARIARSLDLTGLLPHLAPHLFSGTMVARGKPAPDLFLHAAAAMGAEPARTIVVEDSLAGIEAGRRAGMRVIAFTAGSHMTDGDPARHLVEAGAHDVAATAADLGRRLREIAR